MRWRNVVPARRGRRDKYVGRVTRRLLIVRRRRAADAATTTIILFTILCSRMQRCRAVSLQADL